MENLVDYVKKLKYDSQTERDIFIALAEEYTKGGELYYTMTPSELSVVTEIKSEAQWTSFLNNKSIKMWLDKRLSVLLDTLQRRSAMQYLKNIESGNVGSSDIKNIANIINENKDKDNGIRIVLTRIPDKVEEDAIELQNDTSKVRVIGLIEELMFLTGRTEEKMEFVERIKKEIKKL